MSDGDDKRTIVDEFGELIQRQSTRGRWVDHKRNLTGRDGAEYTINLEPRRVKTQDYLDAMAGSGVDVRMNDMNDRIEVNGDPITDAKEAVIINRLRDLGLKGERRMRDALLEQAHKNRYHPIRDYLRGLTWEGADHIGNFISHFKPAGKSAELMPVYWRKWFIGAVAKVMEGGQNFMLVLDGPQGIGKSYLARWLCPADMQSDYFIEGAIQPDDKDSYIRLMSKWIWEVGELQATTRRADMEALKDFISRRDVTVRVPFGKYDITKPSSASLVGTINESGSGFLGDMTGTRRFGICQVDNLDWSYTSINVSDLWAQAMHLYLDGAAWELTKEERRRQEIVNEEYEMPSTVGELFYRYFEFEPEADPTSAPFLPSSEILNELKLRGLSQNRDRVAYMELAAIMRRENVRKEKIDNVNGYVGVWKKEDHKVIGGNGTGKDAHKINL